MPPPLQQPADGPVSQGILDVSAHRPPVDREIARVAAAQHGVVALWELEELGVGKAAAHWRVTVGRLHRLYQGVYAVGHLPSSREATLAAAVLACGPEAVLSHRSAAELWGLLNSVDGPIDVIAPRRRGRAPRGVRAHRDGTLVPEERNLVQGIPCATVPRVLLDLAATVRIWELRRA